MFDFVSSRKANIFGASDKWREDPFKSMKHGGSI